jgi:hypothetical protein
MSPSGQSRHFDRAPLTSDLARLADILGFIRHVAKVPTADVRKSSSELIGFLIGDVAKHGRQEQGPRRYYAARRWMLTAASRITSYTRRGWESIGT